jgi:hypothetical protein
MLGRIYEGLRLILYLLTPDTPKARGDRAKLLAKMIIEALRVRGISMAASRQEDDLEEVLTGVLCRCGVPGRLWKYPTEAPQMEKEGCPHLETDSTMDFDPKSILGKSGQATYKWSCLACGSEKVWIGPAPKSLLREAAE